MIRNVTKRFPLKEKLIMINECDEMSQSEVARRHLCSRSLINYLLQNKQKFEEQAKEEKNLSLKRVLPTNLGKVLEEAIVLFISFCNNKKIPITGPLIKEKALETATLLGLHDFKASQGWLNNVLKRNSITHKIINGESASLNLTVVDQWKNGIVDLLDRYKPENIYNADETSFFYKKMPRRSYFAKDQSTAGIKDSKERVTIMFCTSMSGRKIKPVVIGKSKKPHCFRNIDYDELGVNYYANANAWMTGEIFNDWLEKFDKSFELKTDKVLLILDNFSGHQCNFELKNVDLIYLPPNTTSATQPLDAGIIRNWKLNNNKLMIKQLLVSITGADNLDEYIKSINLLQAINVIVHSWSLVKHETIKNCWAHVGFTKK